MESMYDDAVKLQAEIISKAIRGIEANLVSYSQADCRIRVDFFTPTGLPVLRIEYFGNADAQWVISNIRKNRKSL